MITLASLRSDEWTACLEHVDDFIGLRTFDSEHGDRGVSEIAQVTGLHKATTHRIMMTLLNGGFLERSLDGERFRLGIRVVELGLAASRL